MVERQFHHQFNENKSIATVQLEPSNLEPAVLELCFNCGKLHPDTDCEIPTYYIRCPRCWVVSFDRTGHRSPCTPTNTASGFHSNILGQLAQLMFMFRVRKSDADMFFMDPDKKVFELLDQKKLLTRYSFLIAIFVDKQWRIRYRAIATPQHGLLLFKLKKTVGNENVFSSMFSNTVAVYGLKPKSDAMKVDFRVYATGKEDQQKNCNSSIQVHFNGIVVMGISIIHLLMIFWMEKLRNRRSCSIEHFIITTSIYHLLHKHSIKIVNIFV